MEKLSYKTFVWPQNPHTYKEDSSREGKYTKDDAGNDVFLGMGYLKSVITCTGAFFGANAVTEFQKLQKLFEETNPGDLEHPLWGIRHCYFTGLELLQEPKDNYVAYKAEFQLAQTNGYLPK